MISLITSTLRNDGEFKDRLKEATLPTAAVGNIYTSAFTFEHDSVVTPLNANYTFKNKKYDIIPNEIFHVCTADVSAPVDHLRG